MSTPEVFDDTAFAAGFWGSGGTDDLGEYSGGAVGTTTATLTGTLTEVGSTATAMIDGAPITLRAYSDTTDGVVFTTPDFTTFYIFTTAPFSPSQEYPLSYTVAGNSGLACFLAGTRIATAGGERPVERLCVGMKLRALRRGGTAPVRWLGRRRIRNAGPANWPVRIAAGAFADGVPRRDLLLSPDHAVFAGGGLIPVRYLCNGATIAPAPRPQCDYWHVELAAHDLLLAEGMPVESYLDTGNRWTFERGGPPAAPIGGTALARQVWARRGCAPLLLGRPAQAPVRRHLLARAAMLGHPRTRDPGLAVLADGTPLALAGPGPGWEVTVPAGTARLHLLSRSAVPAEIEPASADPRRLGVAVTHLALDGVAIPLGPPWREAGWHAPEPGLHWTDGAAVLACGGPVARDRRLQIAIAPLLHYWCESGRRPSASDALWRPAVRSA